MMMLSVWLTQMIITEYSLELQWPLFKDEAFSLCFSRQSVSQTSTNDDAGVGGSSGGWWWSRNVVNVISRHHHDGQQGWDDAFSSAMPFDWSWNVLV